MIISLWMGFACTAGGAGTVETGTVRPTFANRTTPNDAAHLTPPPAPFDWRLEETMRVEAVTAFRLTFPSPITTEEACNNTVWCEFFLPEAPGRVPGVVVLHYLNDPNFLVTRYVSLELARRGMATLMLKMPYYGERRPPGDMNYACSGRSSRPPGPHRVAADGSPSAPLAVVRRRVPPTAVHVPEG